MQHEQLPPWLTWVRHATWTSFGTWQSFNRKSHQGPAAIPRACCAVKVAFVTSVRSKFGPPPENPLFKATLGCRTKRLGLAVESPTSRYIALHNGKIYAG